MGVEREFERLCQKVKRKLRRIGLNLDLEFVLKMKQTSSHYWEGRISIGGKHARDEEVFWHEVGHAFYEQYLIGRLKGCQGIFGKPASWLTTYAKTFLWDWDILKPSADQNRFLNEYCELCPEEDFCECFSYVMCNFDPEDLSKTIKSKLRYVEGRISAYSN